MSLFDSCAENTGPAHRSGITAGAYLPPPYCVEIVASDDFILRFGLIIEDVIQFHIGLPYEGSQPLRQYVLQRGYISGQFDAATKTGSRTKESTSTHPHPYADTLHNPVCFIA